SRTPSIEFSPYSRSQSTGTRLDAYATDEANVQNLITNVITYRTCRCEALSADIHSPTPRAVATARTSSTGSHSAAAVGRMPDAKVKIAITTNPMEKSTSPESAVEIGRIIRGK